MEGRFVPGGCCLLDFYLFWTEEAIWRRDADAAYRNARQLAHLLLSILEPQPALPLEPAQSAGWQRQLDWHRYVRKGTVS